VHALEIDHLSAPTTDPVRSDPLLHSKSSRKPKSLRQYRRAGLILVMADPQHAIRMGWLRVRTAC
jgi:hypothetical protein